MSGNPREHQEQACRAYFESYLPGLQGQLLISGLKSLSCALGVVIDDLDAGGWTLVVEAGRLSTIVRGITGATAVFRLDVRTLLDIATGVLPPDKAFFDLRIEIEGDVALGLQLSTVLEPFFRQFPFQFPQ